MPFIRRSPLILALLLPTIAVAQQADDADRVEPAQPSEAVQPEKGAPTHEPPVVFRQVPRQAQPQMQLPPFESMVVRGADGKIVRIDRQLDLMALQRNVLIDDTTREKIRPVIREWLADLDQLVIDNLDFIERIEPPDGSPSVLEKLTLNDQATVQPVGQMMNMLISAGPLTPHLQNRGVLTREQAQLNENIKSDYLQSVMNEVLAAHQVRPGEELRNEEQRRNQVDTIARHVYSISCLDAMSSYYRQLAEAAPYASQIVAAAQLDEDTRGTVEPFAAAAQQLENDMERRAAIRELLNHLSFDERREFLQRAREIVPEADVLKPNPA